MDVMQLFATMMTNHRLRQLASSDERAWLRAGSSWLPLSWQAVTMVGTRFDILSLEAKLFLKYVVLLERSCAQALISPDFRPYCLKCTGVCLSSLSRALPSPRPISDLRLRSDTCSRDSRATQHLHTSLHTRDTRASLGPATFHRNVPFHDDVDDNRHASVGGELPLSLERMEMVASSSNERPHEDAPGGEVVNVDSQPFVISSATPTTKRQQGILRRGFSKLKHVVHIFHKPTKSASTSAIDTKASSSHDRSASFTKRTVKYAPHHTDSSGNVTLQVDEAWFGLPDSKQALLQLGSSRSRAMSEEDLLVRVISVYRFNPRVISVGAYIVRRLCYLEPPALLNNLHSIRARLSSTSIVEVLLEALHIYRKEYTLVAAILVALGNLALNTISASAIGEEGLPLVVKVMKRHRSVQKVVDYGNFLLLNVCDGHAEFKRKLRDLEFPQLAMKEVEKFNRQLKPNGRLPTGMSTPLDLISSSQQRLYPPMPTQPQQQLLQLQQQRQQQYQPEEAPSNAVASSSSPTSSLVPHVTTLRQQRDIMRADPLMVSNLGAPSIGSTLTTVTKSKGQLLALLKPVLDSYHFQPPRSQLASSTSFDQRSLTESMPHVIGYGSGVYESSSDGEESVDAPQYDDDDDLDDDMDDTEADDVWSGLVHNMDEVDERTSRWVLKRRPPLSYVHSVFCSEQRLSQLVMIRKYLDVCCVLGADYDILKPDMAKKCSALIGDLVVTLFGIPLPHVDSLLVASFRCLLVLFEWGVQNQDWAYCGPFAHSLLLLSETFLKSHAILPYMTNCYLVIFSLLWKRWNLADERKRFVEVLAASVKVEALRRPPSILGPITSSSSSSGKATSSAPLPGGATREAPQFSPAPPSSDASPLSSGASNIFLITCAAMLGDFANASYDLKSFIRESGVLPILRWYRDEAQGMMLERLNACLDQFEDNPLLRRGAHAGRRIVAQEEDPEVAAEAPVPGHDAPGALNRGMRR